MTLEQNKAVVQRFVEEVQCQHDLAAIDRLFSPDFVDYSGLSSPPTKEGAPQLFGMMFAAFPDLRVTIRQQVAEGDKVATYKTFHGTHGGPFMGIPATGRECHRHRDGARRPVDRALDGGRHAFPHATAHRRFRGVGTRSALPPLPAILEPHGLGMVFLTPF